MLRPWPPPPPHLLPVHVPSASCTELGVVLQVRVLSDSPGLWLTLPPAETAFPPFLHVARSYSSGLSVDFLSSKRASRKLQAGLIASAVLGCSVPLSSRLTYYVKISVHAAFLLDCEFLEGKDCILYTFVPLHPTECPASRTYVLSMSLEPD